MPHFQNYLAVTGTFDVSNYGDLLFPLITAFKLGLNTDQIIPISPTSMPTALEDTIAPFSWNEVMDMDLDLAGILVGGGNIIHDRPVKLSAYANARVDSWAYESLWMGAEQASKVYQCPLMLNAPGVPYKFSKSGHQSFREFANTAKYLSVRDKTSREYLLASGVEEPIHIVPDTAFSLKEMWSEPDLKIPFMKMIERSDSSLDENFIAVHVKERSVDTDIETFAEALDAFCSAKNVQPILIGIGACHGDDQFTAKLSECLRVEHVNLSRPKGLKEIAAAIAFSKAYIGASMHGYITARVYNRPGLIVANPVQHKLTDLVKMLQSKHDIVGNWPQAFKKFDTCVKHHKPVSEDIHTALDTHWSQVRKVLEDYSRRVDIYSKSIRKRYYYKSA